MLIFNLINILSVFIITPNQVNVNFKLKNCGNNLEIAAIIYKNIIKIQ